MAGLATASRRANLRLAQADLLVARLGLILVAFLFVLLIIPTEVLGADMALASKGCRIRNTVGKLHGVEVGDENVGDNRACRSPEARTI